MNGLHVQSVTEQKLDLLFQTEVSEPVPGEHGFGADDQVITEVVDGAQEIVGLAGMLRYSRVFPS
jgi:hypothetical protein